MLYIKILKVFQLSSKEFGFLLGKALQPDSFALNQDIIDPGKSIIIFKRKVPAWLAPMKVNIFEVTKL